MNQLSFLTAMFLEFFGDFINDIFSKIGYAVTEIYTFTVEINQTKVVSLVTMFTTLLGASLCGFVVVKHLLGTYAIGTEGDPDQDPVEIIFRLCKALGMMGMNSWLFTELLKLSNAVGNDITTALLGGKEDITKNFINQIISFVSKSTQSPFISIYIGVIAGCVILYIISASLRGAELTLNKILFPIFCLDIINTNSEKWNMFTFQYGISFFSYTIQMFCFSNFMLQFLTIDISQMDFKKMLAIIGWLILSIKAPKSLEKYIYATGTGNAVSQGASRLGQVVTMVGMRM